MPRRASTAILAVVHADGNGIGQRMRDIGEDEHYATADKNRDFVLELRRLSINVQLAAQKALQAVLDRLTNCIIDKDGEKFIVYEPNPYIFTQIKLISKENCDYLPFPAYCFWR